MKVLHITNWYPYDNDQNGDFIQRHIDIAKTISDTKMVHIEVREGKWKFINTLKSGNLDRRLLIYTPIKSFKVKEILTAILIFYFYLQEKEKYDLYLFHIAYPTLRFTKFILRLFNNKIAILEHWSAYSQGFFLPEESKARQKIASIFRHNMPVIAVSKMLMQDIVTFAKYDKFDKYIVPNAINENYFYLKKEENKDEITFLMLGAWDSKYKQLMIGVKAFHKAVEVNSNIKLLIGGDGDKKLNEVRDYIKENSILKDKIVFLGVLEYKDVGDFMRKANLLLHPSTMETFSLVCAESMFCGTPVFASNLPAIASYMTEYNGKLLENKQEVWDEALIDFVKTPNIFDYKKVGENVRNTYSNKAVAQKMKEVFTNIIQKRR